MSHDHVQPPRDADPGVTLSDQTPVRAPLRFWLTLFASTAAGVLAWAHVKGELTQDARRLDAVETEQREARTLLREVRETTSRMDARLEAMQRQMDRPSGRE
jgi:uncharacterized protein YlxW (UPF0749 family)